MKHSMGKRGVTRPMELMEHGNESEKNDSHSSMKPRFQRHGMLEKHHKQTDWIYWTLIILGFWLVLAPLTLIISRILSCPPEGEICGSTREAGVGPFFLMI